ncbi:NADPH-dependent F420 reductase [Salipiger sp. P9]|uniref:NADPH-dependent F420 reductase n=1 Tax=Salipiger pentaromativorans TaxID=2943193 RepID=UPI0021579EAD|nr:NADPH-dependent F420 reductase [Salipiger pentaromativorans]MCR8547510.1 NADPH-dependent F420 reductase [Salipiger pentaromativorans]
MSDKPKIAIIGGTGALGAGIAGRLARAGYPVVIGSRDAAKAGAAALEIGDGVTGSDYAGAASAAEIVILAVPWSVHEATLADLAPVLKGRILVDAVVPLVPPKVSVVQLPEGGSAAQIAQDTLGDEVRVVGAFHNIGAAKLAGEGDLGCDVLVSGNDKEAKATVIALCEVLGSRGIDCGPIQNAAAAEAMTSLLIGINRRYKASAAGIRITGIDK